MQIRDVMNSQLSVVKPETPISEVARKMRDEEIEAVPVAGGGKLIGVVTDRDIVTRGLVESRDISRIRARDVMSPQVLYCFEDEALADVLIAMQAGQVRCLPVVNGERRLVGMVSLSALRRAGNLRACETPRPSLGVAT